MEYVLKNRLKELRARDSLNQTELAKLAEVSRQTISLIERGSTRPRWSLPCELLKFLTKMWRMFFN
ncbi:Cro/CI family transcriptional regulator [Streptococcus suis]|nr:Cro/CI family transcriptional regulator [Streptococcus suis]